MTWQRGLIALLAAVLGLPILTLLTLGIGRLLAALHDLEGAQCLNRLAAVEVVLWLTSLVGLVVCLTLRQVNTVASEFDAADDEELE